MRVKDIYDKSDVYNDEELFKEISKERQYEILNEIQDLIQQPENKKKIRLSDAIAIAENDDEISFIVKEFNNLNIEIVGMDRTLEGLEDLEYTSRATGKNKKMDKNDPMYDPLHLPKGISKKERNKLINQYNDSCFELIEQYPNNEQARKFAVEKLIMGNMRLVRMVINNFKASHKDSWNPMLDDDDLLDIGRETIYDCFNKFDRSRGYTFATYFIPCLYGKLNRNLDIANFGKGKSATGVYTEHRMAVKAKKMIEKDDISIEEASNMNLKISTEKIQKALETIDYVNDRTDYYKDNEIPEDTDRNRIDGTDVDENLVIQNGIIYDKTEEALMDEQNVIYEVEKTMFKEQLDEVLSTLREREAKVLRLRFGLDDGVPKTLEETARVFEVTRERIRQIEAKALRKLRHPARSIQLKDFLDNDNEYER